MCAGILYDTITYVVVRLREWRDRRGYSVRGLAKAAGVGYVSIVRIEQGRMSPTVDLLEKLAPPLGIAIRDFFPPAPHRSRKERRDGE